MTRSLPWVTKREREKNASKTRAIFNQPSKSHVSAAANAFSIHKCVKEAPHSSAINPIPPFQEDELDQSHKTHDLSRHGLMHDGFDADDKWRMVEDELLETAKTFTQSLRQAEYEKLMKNIMDGKSSGTYKISRPTIFTSQTISKAKGLNVQGQKKAPKRKLAKDSDDEDDTPWMKDDCLADLMTSFNTNAIELMDIPEAGLPDDPPVVSRPKNFSSSGKITQGACSTDQDPDSDTNDDLDYFPSTYPIRNLGKKPAYNDDRVQSDFSTIRREETGLEAQTMYSVTSDSYPKKDKTRKATTEVPRNRVDTTIGPNNGCVNIKQSPFQGDGILQKKPITLSLKSNTQKFDKKKYNTKAVPLHEIPTFLV